MVKKKSLKSKKEKTNTTPAIFSYIVNFCINRKHQPEEFMPNKKEKMLCPKNNTPSLGIRIFPEKLSLHIFLTVM